MPGKIDVAADLEQHRAYLMRVAQLQLRDEDAAQDVVQETMLAAIASGSFTGQSSLRTWLTSILKHKIVDLIRKRRRSAELTDSAAEDQFDPTHEEFHSPFDHEGRWHDKPAAWGDPEQALRQREFLDILALCMQRLPANTARVFVMREYLELEVGEISAELRLKADYVYVLLFRARAMLRGCIEKKWLGTDGCSAAARRGRRAA